MPPVRREIRQHVTIISPVKIVLREKSLYLNGITKKTKLMQKTRQFVLILSAAAWIMTMPACSNDNKNEGNPDPSIVPTQDVTTEAFYKGDIYGSGAGNLWIYFISDMEYDADLKDYIGPGYILCLDFNTTLAENADFATLAAGTYTSDYSADSHQPFTLNIANGDSFLSQYDSGGSTKTQNIAGGSVTVSLNKGYYCIDADLQLEDGSKYTYSFIGNISFLNRSKEGQMSNLTQDVSVDGMTQALLAYVGMAFTETSDLYTVIIAGPDYDLDNNFGLSDALTLSLNVTPGSSKEIPAGTYTLIDAATADDYDVGTALSGVYEPTYGGYFGSWFFSTAGQIESAARTGSIKVSHSGGNDYTFVIDLKDGYGHRISGTFSGHCLLKDWSQQKNSQ